MECAEIIPSVFVGGFHGSVATLMSCGHSSEEVPCEVSTGQVHSEVAIGPLFVLVIFHACIIPHFGLPVNLNLRNFRNFCDSEGATLVGRCPLSIGKLDSSGVGLAFVMRSCEEDTVSRRERLESKDLRMCACHAVLVIFHECIIP